VIAHMIAELRNCADQAGDADMVATCDRALDGDKGAVADCLAVCRETEVNRLDMAAWCTGAKDGTYLAVYWEGERDPGSRCGWSDSALSEIRRRLRARGLTLRADDVGLVVATLEEQS
jgi:hypothetical protein